MHTSLFFVSLLLQLPLSSAVTVDYSSIANERGDTLPDFSFCGYHASQYYLPSNTGKVTTILQQASGDQQSRIQSALDNVASNGGGVVLLGVGTFEVYSTLTIPSGTVLRGSGVNQTILNVLNGSSTIINLGSPAGTETAKYLSNITDSYVPIGASQVHVSDPSGFEVGDAVFVEREVSASWIRAQGMADLVRNNKAETWLAAGTVLDQPRSIQAIQDNTLVLDVPLTDYIFNDVPYSMNGQVQSYTPPAASTEMGLEDFSINLWPSCSNASLTDTSCTSPGIAVTSWTTNSWIRNLDMTGFLSFINVAANAKQITIADVAMYRDQPSNKSAGYASDIAILGTQILVANSSTHGAASAKSFSVATMSRVPGPNAVLNHTTEQTSQQIYPHERWAHGFLIDNSTADIYLMDRGIEGSGHGWAINAGVAWNTKSSTVNVSASPLGNNYCIGCKYSTKPAESNGTFLYENEDIDPPSLFAAQLAARAVRTSPNITSYVFPRVPLA